MKVIDSASVFYKEGDEHGFSVYSKWLKPLFSNTFVPYSKFIDTSNNTKEMFVKEFFPYVYFYNIDKVLNSSYEDKDIVLESIMYHQQKTNDYILNKIDNKYVIGDYTYVEDNSMLSYFKCKTLFSKIEVEDQFYLKWNKVYGNRNNELINKIEPKSCLKNYSFFDRYYIIKFNENDFSFETEILRYSNNLNILRIRKGAVYLMNNLFSLDDEVYIAPYNNLGVSDWYTLKRYDPNVNYYQFWNDRNSVYVFSDKTGGEIECLICLFPIFNNGMITKRLIYDVTENINGSNVVFCVEHNDFLAGINPPSGVINNMYNKIIIGLIDKSLFETKVDFLCLGMFAILGKVSVYFNPNNQFYPEFVSNTLETQSFTIKFKYDTTIFNTNINQFSCYWDKSNHILDRFNIVEDIKDNVGVPINKRISLQVKYLFPYLIKNVNNAEYRTKSIRINCIDCGDYKYNLYQFNFS